MSELSLIYHKQEEQSILKQLTFASLQTAFSFLLEFLPNTILLYMLELNGDSSSVAAFGLGVLTTQAFGMGILNGLATGLETLVSQAFGAHQFELCSKLLYRSLYLCTLFMIPISLFLIFSDNILSLINSNESLTQQTGQFNRYMILAVYINGIFVNWKVFLNGQNIYNYQFYTQLITCITFLIITYYLVIILDLKLIGCAISLTLLDILNIIILFAFIYVNKCCKNTLFPLHLNYLKNSIKFLKEAIPIGAILWLEWISFDFYVVLASYLDEQIINAHVLMQNYAGVFYQFSYGISIAATTFVGNEMGRKKIFLAKQYCKTTFIIDAIFLFITQALFIIFGNYFFDLLTDNQIISNELKETKYFLIAFVIFDGIQAVVSGLVRAVGREKNASLTFIICYLIFGEIIGYFFCYIIDLKLKGIWIGIVIGAITYDCVQIINLFWVDWNQLAEKIEEKLTNLHQQGNQIDIDN